MNRILLFLALIGASRVAHEMQFSSWNPNKTTDMIK